MLKTETEIEVGDYAPPGPPVATPMWKSRKKGGSN